MFQAGRLSTSLGSGEHIPLNQQNVRLQQWPYWRPWPLCLGPSVYQLYPSSVGGEQAVGKLYPPGKESVPSRSTIAWEPVFST